MIEVIANHRALVTAFVLPPSDAYDRVGVTTGARLLAYEAYLLRDLGPPRPTLKIDDGDPQTVRNEVYTTVDCSGPGFHKDFDLGSCVPYGDAGGVARLQLTGHPLATNLSVVFHRLPPCTDPPQKTALYPLGASNVTAECVAARMGAFRSMKWFRCPGGVPGRTLHC